MGHFVILFSLISGVLAVFFIYVTILPSTCKLISAVVYCKFDNCVSVHDLCKIQE